jgi:hypothetical protein
MEASSLNNSRAEEKRRVVLCREVSLQLLLLYDGRKLADIAEEDDLGASKGLSTGPVKSKRCVDGVKKVSTHHRNLVNHNGIDLLEHIGLLMVYPNVLFLQELWGELKERVNRYSSDVQSSHSAWGNDYNVLLGS